MSIRPGIKSSPFRWREDVGFEARCPDCATSGGARFWPITTEFWDPNRGMTRCRGCHDRRAAANLRKRYRLDAQKRLERNRRYRAANRDAQRIKDAARWAAVKADPERLSVRREQNRLANAAYKQRVNARRAA